MRSNSCHRMQYRFSPLLDGDGSASESLRRALGQRKRFSPLPDGNSCIEVGPVERLVLLVAHEGGKIDSQSKITAEKLYRL